MLQSQTVILFFSRTLEDEFKVNDLGLSRADFESYYHWQVQKTLSVAKSSGLALETCYSDEQIGSSFGERLQHALKGLVQKGYSSVIVLGNDTPLLNQDHLFYTAKVLSQGSNLLGQNQHGGAWIIGMQLEDMLIDRMNQLAWNTHSLFDELSLYLESPTLLEHSIDLNSKRDFGFFLKSSIVSKALKRRFRLFLTQFEITIVSLSDWVDIRPNASLQRGPPVLN